MPSAPVVASVRTGHADVDLTGLWVTGNAGEPAQRQIVLHPQCNYQPASWSIQQNGDTVKARTVSASWDKGTASSEPRNQGTEVGWVSGTDLTMGTAGSRYILHYDSTSGHLRGTVNDAPFWAVRAEIVHPEKCIAVP